MGIFTDALFWFKGFVWVSDIMRIIFSVIVKF